MQARLQQPLGQEWAKLLSCTLPAAPASIQTKAFPPVPQLCCQVCLGAMHI